VPVKRSRSWGSQRIGALENALVSLHIRHAWLLHFHDLRVKRKSTRALGYSYISNDLEFDELLNYSRRLCVVGYSDELASRQAVEGDDGRKARN